LLYGEMKIITTYCNLYQTNCIFAKHCKHWSCRVFIYF